MRKIVLICAYGMSTSLLVNRMREAADKQNYECDINAYGLSQAAIVGKDADIVLIGPQVRFQLKAVQDQLPDIIVEAMDMKDYGTMNGEKIITDVKNKLGD